MALEVVARDGIDTQTLPPHQIHSPGTPPPGAHLRLTAVNAFRPDAYS